MAPVLIVQEISVHWDKSARGGENAERRNVAPEVAKVPLERNAVANSSLLQHDVTFGAFCGFALPQEKVIIDAEIKPIELRCVRIDWRHEQVQATFRWIHAGGAPDRGLMSKTLTLGVNAWGQIVYNGRLTDYDGGHWSYHKTVVNVGLFAPPSNSVFTRCPPTQRYAALAHLFWSGLKKFRRLFHF